MKKKDLTFKDVYKLPLKKSEYSTTYIWSANGIMTFKNLIKNKELTKEILSILNGNSNKAVNFDITYDGRHDGRYIKIDGHPAFLLRGWGYLTGCGTLNLPTEKAAKIQDDFAKWVVNKLKGLEL